MKDESEKVQTFLPNGRKGEYILKTKYERWSGFILSMLSSEKNYTLNDVLEKARSEGATSSHTEIGWDILQVKRDLEARGFITSVEDPNRRHTFYLKLTRQGLSKLNYDNQMAEWLKAE